LFYTMIVMVFVLVLILRSWLFRDFKWFKTKSSLSSGDILYDVKPVTLKKSLQQFIQEYSLKKKRNQKSFNAILYHFLVDFKWNDPAYNVIYWPGRVLFVWSWGCTHHSITEYGRSNSPFGKIYNIFGID
jgi:hypothetical protein